MTTFRKWRFTILIGSCVLAAGALLYFANARANSQKTQGAIGKRDVYRDGQVDAAGIGATPGTAPVAMTAILESKEFKALSKNESFHSLLNSHGFQELAKDASFVGLLKDSSFQRTAQNQNFFALIRDHGFQRAIALSNSGLSTGMGKQDLTKNSAFSSFKQDEHFQQLTKNEAFNTLLKDAGFSRLVKNEAFIQLLSTGGFQGLMKDQSFLSLVSQSSFEHALLNGSTASLSNALHSGGPAQ